jgi:UDP-N-acetylglucosamine 4-epimerase
VPLIDQVEAELKKAPARWLVTGAAGFIGSHLVERLLALGQTVVGLDDFSAGYEKNLDEALAGAGAGAKARWRFVKGDCADPAACRAACDDVDYVLHQAALGSVPRSIADPWRTHRANVDGFVQILIAARDAKVRRFVYASSSSVYGDDAGLPKVEERVGRPLSPYAVSKRTNELYAQAFQHAYGMSIFGLRYFNVFGPRQDPNGAYAAVVPRWIAALSRGEVCEIYGDGETSRDFCYVANAVQANLLAATQPKATDGVANVAVGERTSLKRLYALIREQVAGHTPKAQRLEPVHKPFRDGDIRDSQADLARARQLLGYRPSHSVAQGLHETAERLARTTSSSA